MMDARRSRITRRKFLALAAGAAAVSAVSASARSRDGRLDEMR